MLKRSLATALVSAALLGGFIIPSHADDDDDSYHGSTYRYSDHDDHSHYRQKRKTTVRHDDDDYYRRAKRKTTDPAVTAYWAGVQQALNKIGLIVGTPDGVPGNKTRTAVRQFQLAIHTEPTGMLSQADYAALMKRAGMPAASAVPATAVTTVAPDPTVIAPPPPTAAVAPATTVVVAPAPAAVAPAATIATAPAAAATAPAAATGAPLAPTEIDGVAQSNSIMGVTVGSPVQTALQTFNSEIGGCTTAGAFTECVGQSAGMTDQVSFAAGNSGLVYFLGRRLTLAQPVPRAALTAKLAGTLPKVIADPDMMLTSSAACDRALKNGGPDVMHSAVKAFASGAADGTTQLVPLATRCRAAFAVSFNDTGAGVQDLDVVLFDGRAIGGLTAGAAATTNATLPTDLKF
jgi:peptidoglycan hydrolase-like protein with peptidoglycan-binding domain